MTAFNDLVPAGPFRIWYAKPERAFRAEPLPDPDNMEATHVLIGDADVPEAHLNPEHSQAALEHLFYRMQGEVWSPNGEARSIIEVSGCGHTSMSVGDCVQDTREGGAIWICANFGWNRVG